MAKKLSVHDLDYRSKLLKECGFKDEEILEINVGQFGKSGFPNPVKTYRLLWQIYDLSIEESYFWILDVLQGAFPIVEKLEDSFAAAENSAFFGITQQRLGAQQDKVSQFLATTGKMVKELFQMVRELRIIDERLIYYNGVEKELEKPLYERSRTNEITLKGLFVDLVQGGGKSAASIYGLAQQLEFVTLPDLFFDAPPFKTGKELTDHIKSLEKDFNRNVLRVLERHLNQYTTWRESTHKEHRSRREFMLKYLEQHYNIIQMYIAWIKPYLRNVAKLSLKERSMSTPDILASFETSMMDVEILARKPVKTLIKARNDDEEDLIGYDCLLATFKFRTRAEMKVQQEYQRGPVHIGRMEFELRPYIWTTKEINNYRKVKEKETLMLIGDVSESVQQAMEALGEELEKYLNEAKGKRHKENDKEEKEEKPQKKSVAEKFFGDFYHSRQKKGEELSVSEKEKAEAISNFKKSNKPGLSLEVAQATFKNFKKAHRMVA